MARNKVCSSRIVGIRPVCYKSNRYEEAQTQQERTAQKVGGTSVCLSRCSSGTGTEESETGEGQKKSRQADPLGGCWGEFTVSTESEHSMTAKHERKSKSRAIVRASLPEVR